MSSFLCEAPCIICSVPSISLQRLQELHLQHNSIEVLSDQALVGLTSLALLDLSRNNLHTIGPTSLRPLVSLQVLRITGEMRLVIYLLPFITLLYINTFTCLMQYSNLFQKIICQ